MKKTIRMICVLLLVLAVCSCSSKKEKEDFSGYWEATHMVFSGEEYNEELLKEMRDLGLLIEMEIEGNDASINITGYKYNVTFDFDKKKMTNASGETRDFTYEDGKLTFTDEFFDAQITFERGVKPEATPTPTPEPEPEAGSLVYPEWKYEAYARNGMVVFVPKDLGMSEYTEEDTGADFVLVSDNNSLMFFGDWVSKEEQNSTYEELKASVFEGRNVEYVGDRPYFSFTNTTEGGQELFYVYSLLEGKNGFWDLYYCCTPENSETMVPVIKEILKYIYFE